MDENNSTIIRIRPIFDPFFPTYALTTGGNLSKHSIKIKQNGINAIKFLLSKVKGNKIFF